MATVFDSRFRKNGFPGLLKQFGESITYMPRSGGSRPITAIVEREPPAIMDAAGNAVVPRFIVRVYNSDTEGIASSEIDTGGDEIEMTEDTDSVSTKTFSVGQVISQGGGVLRFSVV